MTVESRLTDVEESLRLLRDADRLQGRRVSATAPTDKQVVMWNATDKRWEPVTGAQILFARATSDLTLTTSAQSITGDGDSSKVRLVLPTIGDWLIEAVFDFDVSVGSAGIAALGELYVDDSGSAESGSAYKHCVAVDRATVAQRWKVTTTAADTPVELKAKISGAGPTAKAIATHTTLVASIGIGGGSVAAASDHGALTGLSDASDHEYAILKDGTRAYTGEQSMGTNKLTSVVDPTTNQDAATKKYVDDNDHTKYLDSAAIAAVEGEATLDLTGAVTIVGNLGLSNSSLLKFGSDTTIERAGINRLQLPNQVLIGSSSRVVLKGSTADLQVFGTAELSGGIGLFVDGGSVARLQLWSGGVLEWGPGNAAGDVSLKRASANVLELAAGDTFNVDTLNETTADEGVTVDGVLLKDGEIAEGAIPAAIARDTELHNKVESHIPLIALSTEVTF